MSVANLRTVALLLAAAFTASASGQAQTYSVLYSFAGGTDGALPQGALVLDSAGNLYGTTANGGLDNFGTVFKLDPTGNETVLHQFTGGADGGAPTGALIRDSAGNLYGTTVVGGIGNGTIFKVDSTGKETVLYSFTGGADGTQPYAGLTRDSKRNLYGVTSDGGLLGAGTVFKLDKTGKKTVLHHFSGHPDGAHPSGGLVRDSAGNLYGTTVLGGIENSGAVFKVDPTGKETVLYSFTGTGGGVSPSGSLIRDSAANLYGTTCSGGNFDVGTIFKLDSTGTLTILYSFTGPNDGVNPCSGVIRNSGNLYGTTYGGGPNRGGTVFKLAKTGTLTVLYSFPGTNGSHPNAGLLRDSAGNLYGTAMNGGTTVRESSLS